MNAIEFLKRAGTEGRIVSSGDLTSLQIAEAQACRRFFVDEATGYGWAILPWDLTTAKDRGREVDYAKGAAAEAAAGDDARQEAHKLREELELHRDAGEAALRYDASIYGRAARGEYQLQPEGHAIAEGEDLDSLYFDWINKTRRAMGLPPLPPLEDDAITEGGDAPYDDQASRPSTF